METQIRAPTFGDDQGFYFLSFPRSFRIFLEGGREKRRWDRSTTEGKYSISLSAAFSEVTVEIRGESLGLSLQGLELVLKVSAPFIRHVVLSLVFFFDLNSYGCIKNHLLLICM